MNDQSSKLMTDDEKPAPVLFVEPSGDASGAGRPQDDSRVVIIHEGGIGSRGVAALLAGLAAAAGSMAAFASAAGKIDHLVRSRGPLPTFPREKRTAQWKNETAGRPRREHLRSLQPRRR